MPDCVWDPPIGALNIKGIRLAMVSFMKSILKSIPKVQVEIRWVGGYPLTSTPEKKIRRVGNRRERPN